MLSQNERILRHIKDHGSITTLEAFQDYGVTRLSARIWDLRHKMGHEIESETIAGKNRYGETTTFSKYFISGQ